MEVQRQRTETIEAAKEARGYRCTDCDKIFKQKWRYTKHRKSDHDDDLEGPIENAAGAGLPNQERPDKVAVLYASLMKCLLLLLDTSDAFKYGDANRVFRNAKFEILLYDVCKHTQYKQWMF